MSRFARENPENWEGAWERLIDRADNMRKRAKEEGSPSSVSETAPLQESANAASNDEHEATRRLSASLPNTHE